MKLSLILASVFVLASFPSVAAAEKKPKPQTVKVHVCESVDLYYGPVSAETRRERIASGCVDVAPASAQKKIQTCNAQGAERCEVIVTKDHTIAIEHKIQATKGTE